MGDCLGRTRAYPPFWSTVWVQRERSMQRHNGLICAAANGWVSRGVAVDVSGQVRVGLWGERVTGPGVKLVFGRSALHERGLEHVAHRLTVRVRSPEA